MGNERLVNVAVPVVVCLVPLDCPLEAILPLGVLSPAQGVELGGVDGVAEVVEGAVGDEGDKGVHLVLHAEGADDLPGDLDVRELVVAADVVNVTDLALVEDDVKGPGDILDEEEVARVAAVTVEGDGAAA